MIDDLDLLGARAEARERVDESLQPVVLLDDLVRRGVAERVRLVVDHERSAVAEVKGIQKAVHEHAVVDEGEVALLLDTLEGRDAAGEIGLAVRGDEAANQLVLELRHDRRREVDLLEQRVHGAADLRPGPLADLLQLDRPFAHPEPVAREVLVRALLEERDRREREPAHAMERRIRQRHERRQLGSRRRKRYLLQCREERQLTFLLDLLLLRDRGVRPEAIEPDEQPRVAAHELDGRVAGLRELLLGGEPVEHPGDRRRCLALRAEIDGAGHDQPLLRPGHRDVVEA